MENDQLANRKGNLVELFEMIGGFGAVAIAFIMAPLFGLGWAPPNYKPVLDFGEFGRVSIVLLTVFWLIFWFILAEYKLSRK